MSSKPMTDSWPGTVTPSRSAAASTPMAWVSEAAKIAVGGSWAFSSWAACSAAVAVAWTLRNPAVHAAIVGFRSPAQLDAIVGAATLVLDDDDLHTLEAGD